MTDIKHHIPDPLIAAYVSGSLQQPYAVVLATHISLCAECRARYEAHLAMGGAVLDTLPSEVVSPTAKSRLMAEIGRPERPIKVSQGFDIYPSPLAKVLNGKPPKWRSVGLGAKQSILSSGRDGNLRLLYIPAGQAVPDHGHRGMELTLVLQGSFSDEDGSFGVGDLEVADQEVEHTPVAGREGPCICLAATDAPLRFNSLMPRILQPFLKI